MLTLCWRSLARVWPRTSMDAPVVRLMLVSCIADELAVAGGAYGNFDGEGAAAYGLCVSVGGVFGADVAGAAVGDEEFIGLVE